MKLLTCGCAVWLALVFTSMYITVRNLADSEIQVAVTETSLPLLSQFSSLPPARPGVQVKIEGKIEAS